MGLIRFFIVSVPHQLDNNNFMFNYIVRRLLQAVPTVLLITVGLFTLVNLLPGGPLAGQTPTKVFDPEKIERLRRQLGLDKPLPVQYVVWLIGNDWMKIDSDGDGILDSYGQRKGILRGDFGFSYRTREPVMDEILERLPNTVYLMSIMLGVTIIVAIPIGVISAVKQYSKFDLTVTTLSFLTQAIPSFWLGLILIFIFYGWLHNPFTGEPLLPPGGMYTIGVPFSIWDRIKHLILPVSMALGWVAWYSRYLRSSMLDVINEDYIRTARAKGVTERVVLYKHAFRNAAIPLVTMLALDVPYLIAGTLYIEMIFSWPGMARLFYQAAIKRDYPTLMAILTILAAAVILSNLLADVICGLLDPRVRYE